MDSIEASANLMEPQVCIENAVDFCAECGTETVKCRCAGCHQQNYCSFQCFLAGWNAGHREECPGGSKIKAPEYINDARVSPRKGFRNVEGDMVDESLAATRQSLDGVVKWLQTSGEVIPSPRKARANQRTSESAMESHPESMSEEKLQKKKAEQCFSDCAPPELSQWDSVFNGPADESSVQSAFDSTHKLMVEDQDPSTLAKLGSPEDISEDVALLCSPPELLALDTDQEPAEEISNDVAPLSNPLELSALDTEQDLAEELFKDVAPLSSPPELSALNTGQEPSHVANDLLDQKAEERAVVSACSAPEFSRLETKRELSQLELLYPMTEKDLSSCTTFGEHHGLQEAVVEPLQLQVDLEEAVSLKSPSTKDHSSKLGEVQKEPAEQAMASDDGYEHCASIKSLCQDAADAVSYSWVASNLSDSELVARSYEEASEQSQEQGTSTKVDAHDEDVRCNEELVELPQDQEIAREPHSEGLAVQYHGEHSCSETMQSEEQPAKLPRDQESATETHAANLAVESNEKLAVQEDLGFAEPDKSRLNSSTESQDFLVLKFEDADFYSTDQRLFKMELCQNFQDLGMASADVESMAIQLRPGSIIAEISGPADALQDARARPLTTMTVMGHSPIVLPATKAPETSAAPNMAQLDWSSELATEQELTLLVEEPQPDTLMVLASTEPCAAYSAGHTPNVANSKDCTELPSDQPLATLVTESLAANSDMLIIDDSDDPVSALAAGAVIAKPRSAASQERLDGQMGTAMMQESTAEAPLVSSESPRRPVKSAPLLNESEVRPENEHVVLTESPRGSMKSAPVSPPAPHDITFSAPPGLDPPVAPSLQTAIQSSSIQPSSFSKPEADQLQVATNSPRRPVKKLHEQPIKVHTEFEYLASPEFNSSCVMDPPEYTFPNVTAYKSPLTTMADLSALAAMAQRVGSRSALQPSAEFKTLQKTEIVISETDMQSARLPQPAEEPVPDVEFLAEAIGCTTEEVPEREKAMVVAGYTEDDEEAAIFGSLEAALQEKPSSNEEQIAQLQIDQFRPLSPNRSRSVSPNKKRQRASAAGFTERECHGSLSAEEAQRIEGLLSEVVEIGPMPESDAVASVLQGVRACLVNYTGDNEHLNGHIGTVLRFSPISDVPTWLVVLDGSGDIGAPLEVPEAKLRLIDELSSDEASETEERERNSDEVSKVDVQDNAFDHGVYPFVDKQMVVPSRIQDYTQVFHEVDEQSCLESAEVAERYALPLPLDTPRRRSNGSRQSDSQSSMASSRATVAFMMPRSWEYPLTRIEKLERAEMLSRKEAASLAEELERAQEALARLERVSECQDGDSDFEVDLANARQAALEEAMATKPHRRCEGIDALDEVSDLRQRAEALEFAMERLTCNLPKFVEEIEERQSFKKMVAELDASQRQSKDTEQSLQSRVSILESELAALRQRVAELESDLQSQPELKARIKELEAELAGQEQAAAFDLKSLRSKIQDLEEQLADRDYQIALRDRELAEPPHEAALHARALRNRIADLERGLATQGLPPLVLKLVKELAAQLPVLANTAVELEAAVEDGTQLPKSICEFSEGSAAAESFNSLSDAHHAGDADPNVEDAEDSEDVPCKKIQTMQKPLVPTRCQLTSLLVSTTSLAVLTFAWATRLSGEPIPQWVTGL